MDLRRRSVLVGYTALWLGVIAVARGPAEAQGARPSFETLDFPGADFTTVFGINDRGDVVGIYRDRSGKTHGFARRGGMFTSIDFPGAEFTMARGIGPAGDVVGAYRLAGEPDENLHGFMLNQRSQFSRVDFPGHTSTIAVRLLLDGGVIGCYHDADQGASMRGMKIAGSDFAALDRASSMHTGATADGRTIVGFFTDAIAGRGRGYVLEGAAFTPFDVPDSKSTSAQDVNVSNMIVGVYQDSAGRFHGFARQGGRYASIDVPDAVATRAMGVNGDGTIVGAFVDQAGATHGFVRAPATP
jgi:uncharacterized membrane protein